MPETIDLLHYSSMTPIVDEIKAPQRFLQSLLFSMHDPKPTGKIEISIEQDGREMAPFVTVNGEAVQVTGVANTFQTVEAPNIRIKRAMAPSDLLEKRRPGQPIFSNQAQIAAGARRHVTQELAKLERLIVNRIEWLCAMALRGVIQYSVPDLGNFTISFNKPAGHTIILAGAALWTAATGVPIEQFRQAKRLVADEHGISVTHAIMGQEAASAFLANPNVRAELDNRRFDMESTLSANPDFSPEGAVFLGVYCGIPCWEYSRSLEGAPLIRSKYVEFVTASPSAENVLYFGSINDHDALDGGTWVGERFSKSWVTKDPSVRWALVQSRPLPVMRRPGSVVSIQVVA